MRSAYRIGKGKGHSVSEIFLLALFGIYALFCLVLAVLGIRVFEKASASADNNSDIRSSLFYVVNKIHSSETGTVYLDERKGIPVLVTENVYADEVYETLLYYDEGALKELLIKKGNNFEPEMGDTIIKVKGLEFSRNQDLIRITVSANNGQAYSMNIHSQSR